MQSQQIELNKRQAQELNEKIRQEQFIVVDAEHEDEEGKQEVANLEPVPDESIFAVNPVKFSFSASLQ